jgi:hypothetical protein
MYKIVQLLTRRPDLTPSEFQTAWCSGGGVTRAPGLFRHVFNAPAGSDSPIQHAATATLDGLDELWFDDERAAANYFNSNAGGDRWWISSRSLLAEPGAPTVSGSALLIVEAPAERIRLGIKLMILAQRRADLTPTEFFEYWLRTHIPLALQGPHTRERLLRLELCRPGAHRLTGLPMAPFDGISSMVFTSAADLQQEFESDYYRNVLAADEPRFSDSARSRALFVNEILIYQRTG